MRKKRKGRKLGRVSAAKMPSWLRYSLLGAGVLLTGYVFGVILKQEQEEEKEQAAAPQVLPAQVEEKEPLPPSAVLPPLSDDAPAPHTPAPEPEEDDDSPTEVEDDTTPDSSQEEPTEAQEDDTADETPPDDADADTDTDTDADAEPIDVEKVRKSIKLESASCPALETAYSGKSSTNWGNPKILKNTLRARIVKSFSQGGVNNVQQFIQAPENRLLLAQWQLLHSADVNALARLMHNKKAADSLSPLLNNLPWISSFVYDGELRNVDTALEMIYNMRQVDPYMDITAVEGGHVITRPDMKRYIAAAVAAEYARNGWHDRDRAADAKQPRNRRAEKLMGEYADTLTALRTKQRRGGRKESDPYRLARERYLFFARSWDTELLNTEFAATPNWLLRFICGWEGDGAFGTPTTLAWLRDNVALPAAEYTQAHTMVDYRPTSKYGYSVHSEDYYMPYDPLYPDNFAKEVRDVGGVCVQLSHFGAAAACANGIPALTMGEPGHCSYAVYLNGQWVPANSLSDNRVLVSPYWDLESFTDLELLTQMYSQGKRTRDAQLICTLASALHEAGSKRNARKLYEISHLMQPLYLPLWEQYLTTTARGLRMNRNDILEINAFLCKNLAPEHPELCARYLRELVYPILIKSVPRMEHKTDAFLCYVNNLSTNEKKEWDMAGIFDMQYEAIKRSPKEKQRYLAAFLELAKNSPEFNPALSWAIRKALMDGVQTGNHYLGYVDKVIAEKPRKENPDHDALCKTLDAAIIRAAEDAYADILENPDIKLPSLNTCASLIEKYSKYYLEDGSDAKPQDYPRTKGQLVSPGSIALLSSYSTDSSQFVNHARAFTLKGGHIASDMGANQTLTIVLPKTTAISSIVIIPTAGCKAYADWYVETSTDGKEWTLAETLPNGADTPYVVVSAYHKTMNARYIRINSGGGIFLPGINFRAVHVYDNKTSTDAK